MRYAAVALIALLVGLTAGYFVPRPVAQSRFESNSLAFHDCIAQLRTTQYADNRGWDAASEARALHVLAKQTDCLNTSGFGGLTLSDVECASGYRFLPKEAYDEAVRTHRWDPKMLAQATHPPGYPKCM
jgi:hypothetical protein